MKSSLRKLDAALEVRTTKEIRTAYDRWLAREDVAASGAFEKLCGRFWKEMQASLDELVRYSSELFSLKFAPVQDDSRWSPESGFYHKFWYEPPGPSRIVRFSCPASAQIPFEQACSPSSQGTRPRAHRHAGGTPSL